MWLESWTEYKKFPAGSSNCTKLMTSCTVLYVLFEMCYTLAIIYVDRFKKAKEYRIVIYFLWKQNSFVSSSYSVWFRMWWLRKDSILKKIILWRSNQKKLALFLPTLESVSISHVDQNSNASTENASKMIRNASMLRVNKVIDAS